MKHILLASALVLGCHTQNSQPVTPETRDTLAAPFTLHLPNNPRLVDGKPVVVRARLERVFVDGTPLRFRLRAPDGVKVLVGLQEELFVDDQSNIVERVFVVQATGAVSQPVRIEVSASGKAWGATAIQEVHMGAEPASLRPPLRNGPVLTWNGYKTGTGIALTEADSDH